MNWQQFLSPNSLIHLFLLTSICLLDILGKGSFCPADSVLLLRIILPDHKKAPDQKEEESNT